MEQILSDSQTNLIQTAHNREYRDRLFKAIFGRDNELSKKWRLELYNALNDSNYTDPDALELNTIENVIYIKMYNDVSFLIDSQMTLYEQQSSPNPNMPMRGFLYFAELYQKNIAESGRKLLSEQLLKIPNPNFIVFYNGRSERPEQYDLKLSDAFIHEDKTGRFEWTAHVINISEKHNVSLQKKCKPLYDYVRFVSRINHNWDELGMPMNEAVDEAADWAEKENLLDGLISSEKDEVIGMILTEFNEEAFIKTCQEDGYERGKQEKALEAARNLLADGDSPEKVARCIGLPLEEVQKLAEEIAQTTA
ncbi:MAG: hypothetical protein J5747_01310 [Spirochaetaceae bacterium]|nr:hypothetical protein [Spirochaetaceae bacterium]